jgi:hypothetical protein
MITWVAIAWAATPSCWQGVGVASSAAYSRYDWDYVGGGRFQLAASPQLSLACRMRDDTPASAWFGVDLHPWLKSNTSGGETGQSWMLARVGPSVRFGRWDMAVQGVFGFPYLGAALTTRYHPSARNEAVELRVGATFPGPTMQASLIYSFGPRAHAAEE